jgi:CHASE1-domain containing sensor protein
METKDISKKPTYLFAPQTEKKNHSSFWSELFIYLIGVSMMSLLLIIIFATA